MLLFLTGTLLGGGTMEFQIPCTTWVKEADEKVINALRAADRWLTVEELAACTGLPVHQVEHTLKLLKQQMNMARNREDFFRDL